MLVEAVHATFHGLELISPGLLSPPFDPDPLIGYKFMMRVNTNLVCELKKSLFTDEHLFFYSHYYLVQRTVPGTDELHAGTKFTIFSLKLHHVL
ncbi:hypothetical protein TRIP_B270007 [uncultured Desulfatiglans sp.]|uniref:Uncharacterized protein n=1 Tax=Uncultured Desulfatiglans sp. TaxID=1748965 RepID=A0A653A655_UNCDX|nr:hypothetical protein TRIP_B270007 [uncultured Desulfatiglans sp.]